MVCRQTKICPGECNIKMFVIFDIQTDPLIPGRRSEQLIINSSSSGFYHFNESQRENERKYKAIQVLGPSQRIKTTIVQNGDGDTKLIGSLETFQICFERGLEELEIGERNEIIQTTVFLLSSRIPKRVLKTRGDLLSLKLPWKPIS